VIVDFHPIAETEEMIEGRPLVRDGFVALWAWLAQRFTSRPAERIAFEVMNEPQYYARGATAWNLLQRRAVEAIRSVAPKNLLLLSPIHGSDLIALPRMEPTGDRNSCYVFHFYDPQLLTHLGADWDPYPEKAQGMMRGLLYPATAMTMSKVEMLPGADVRLVGDAVRKYLTEGWDARRIAESIDFATQWANQFHGCVVVSEFGALRGTLDPASRNAWLTDVRTSLEQAGMGWTLWDYADVFGIATGVGAVERIGGGATKVLDPAHATRAFDRAALQALGLAP
jgi:endoglucanase